MNEDWLKDNTQCFGDKWRREEGNRIRKKNGVQMTKPEPLIGKNQ